LRTIYFLNGHGLSEKAIAGLQKSLPQITVQRRGEAFLGVATDNDALGCLIQKVNVNSAAARAGLRDFDVVIAFGDRPVLGANDLIDAIAVYKPGDTVKAVVLREKGQLQPARLFMVNPPSRFWMKGLLVEMLHDEDEFQPLIALGLMANMRVELEITLGRWDLNN
jgi:predicted metalloprotease with PDZ domain